MKNKSLIMNSVVGVLSVLMIVFLACNYAEGATGFNILDFLQMANYLPAEYVVLAVANLFFLIVACLLVVVAVLNVLADCNVIKNEKFVKAMNVTKLVLTIVAVAFALVTMICLLVIGVALGWAMIINLILAVAALVVVIVNKFVK